MKDDKGCNCPYCDEPIPNFPCKPCAATIIRCPACNQPLPHDADECPECGAKRPEPEKEK